MLKRRGSWAAPATRSRYRTPAIRIAILVLALSVLAAPANAQVGTCWELDFDDWEWDRGWRDEDSSRGFLDGPASRVPRSLRFTAAPYRGGLLGGPIEGWSELLSLDRDSTRVVGSWQVGDEGWLRLAWGNGFGGFEALFPVFSARADSVSGNGREYSDQISRGFWKGSAVLRRRACPAGDEMRLSFAEAGAL